MLVHYEDREVCYRGRKIPVNDLAHQFGISVTTLVNRIFEYGWEVEVAAEASEIKAVPEDK